MTHLKQNLLQGLESGNYLHNSSIGKDGGSRSLKQGPGDDTCLGLSLLYNCGVHEDSTLWSYLGRTQKFS
jgi:hypothetical protein